MGLVGTIVDGVAPHQGASAGARRDFEIDKIVCELRQRKAGLFFEFGISDVGSRPRWAEKTWCD